MNQKKDPKISTNQDLIPTKELLKYQRKQEYEKAKAARKEEAKARKEEKKAAKENARLEKDKQLWDSMKKASDQFDISRKARRDGSEERILLTGK